MILVTGGTGLVGAHLLYYLTEKHDHIRATKRSQSTLEPVKAVFKQYTPHHEAAFNKIEWVTANITDIPQLTQAFQGVTHVYHCAAFISFNPKHYQALKKTNIEGTANIVNLCIDLGIQKLCYVSSIATLGDVIDGTKITEETHWNPEANNNAYAITKFGAEMEVWRGAQEGLAVVIVNPGLILGEGFWHSGSGVIIKKAAKGIQWITTGSTGFVDVRDVVVVLIQLMEGTQKNERYILIAENLPYKDLLARFSRVFGVAAPKKVIHKRWLLLLSWVDGISAKIFGTKRTLLKATVESLYTSTYYDNNKVKNHLNHNFLPIQTTIERVAKAYQDYCDSTGSSN